MLAGVTVALADEALATDVDAVGAGQGVGLLMVKEES